MEPLLLGAFLTGLLSSAHCLGMCGTLVGALQLGQNPPGGLLNFQLLYNSGRLLTYACLGAMAGLLGSALMVTETLRTAATVLLLGSDLLVVGLGLVATGWMPKFSPASLEFSAPHRLFGRLLRRGASRGLLWRAFVPGICFGFIPCGLLYAMLLTAAQSGSSLGGALQMLLFGLGTLPVLFVAGTGSHLLKVRGRLLGKIAGGVIAAMGLWNLVRHLRMLDLTGG